jgi:hypothetical protein
MNKEDYIRVTEILSPFTGYTSVPDKIMAPYQRRGTLAHLACNEFIRKGDEWLWSLRIPHQETGALCEMTSEEMTLIVPYVDSFSKWWDPNWDVIEMNRRYYEDDLELTGEVDLIVQIGDENVLIDIKTSKKPNLTWQYQLSAYKKMIQEIGIDYLLVVQIFQDGSEPIAHEYEYDFHTFKKCYDLYHIFFDKRKKVYEEGE